MDTVDMIGLGDLTPRDPLQLPTHCAPGLLVGRAYPLTAAAPVVPSPCWTVQIGTPQRTYTQAELDAAVAAERERWTTLLFGPHLYRGECPTAEPDQIHWRDAECPACRALGDWKA